MDNNRCACIWNHELAMRRLLSLIRQSQSLCGDTECFESLPALPSAEGAATDNFLMFSMMWIAIGFFLYMFRPQALRNMKNIFKGPFNNDEDNNRGGPSGMSPGVQ